MVLVEDGAQVAGDRAAEGGQVAGRGDKGDLVELRVVATRPLGPDQGRVLVAQRRDGPGRGTEQDADVALGAQHEALKPKVRGRYLGSGLLMRLPGRERAKPVDVQGLALSLRWLACPAGQLPTAGSGRPRRHPPDQQPPVVRRLQHADVQVRKPAGGAGTPRGT